MRKKFVSQWESLKLMAVGGINRENVREALDSGYKYVGTAGGLFPKDQIAQMDKEKMLISLKEFEAKLD